MAAEFHHFSNDPLPRDFYLRPTLEVARDLLGKHLVYQDESGPLRGMIVETEAYIGQDDPACHAAAGKTARTALMFGKPGIAYIYFIYGMYYCLNAVTEAVDFPAAVLIRAVAPLGGKTIMQERRPRAKGKNLTNGPGKLCQAFGLDKAMNGADLCASPLFISEGMAIKAGMIRTTTRIGISSGKSFPWRFCLKDNPYVSKPNHR